MKRREGLSSLSPTSLERRSALEEVDGTDATAPEGLILDQPAALVPTRLLLVEDSPTDAAVHTAMLRSTALSELFEIVLVGRLSECEDALAGESPACVLLDMGLPDAQGVDGLLRIRAVAPDVPVVVLTGNNDEAMGLDALQNGAQDYLVKGHVDGRLLARSIRYAIERMRGEQRMHFLAFHDPLTDLANRALFADRLRAALAPSQLLSAAGDRAGVGSVTPDLRATPAVLVIDLDYFKVVNDSLGHASGDLLLQAVALRLQAVVRPSDTVARLGGDEFAILCEHTSADQASLVAQRVVDVLSAPIVVEGAEAFVGASVGVAVARAGSVDDHGLIRDADIAMYRAKVEGRGRFVVFEEKMRTVVQVHHATKNALHRAVERNEFRLMYQPAVNLRTGRICGVEALLRWEEPTRGLLSPESFLASAEESGLIVPIGSWVLGAALEQAGAWGRSFPGREPLSMSVNISGRQLVEPNVVDVVAKALATARVQPQAVCLCLEVTESVLLDDLTVMSKRLTALKALGVQLAVDDFGTGYSSLNYLQRLPVDILKIDRTFVSGLDSGEKDLAIITTLIEMGKRMHLTVVAEGVETAEQLAVLRSLDCDIAQGFFMAHPLSAAAATELMRGDPTW
ncbi:MAG: EAL domain-containing protein [Candidatus Dormibacteria bacterium]|jgi:diguanylate cyclase (GGDEF)-like protein